jgi:hypothetical protein
LSHNFLDIYKNTEIHYQQRQQQQQQQLSFTAQIVSLSATFIIMGLKTSSSPRAAKATATATNKAPSSPSGGKLNPSSLGGKAVIVLANLHMFGITEPSIKTVMAHLGTNKQDSLMVLMHKEKKKGFVTTQGSKTVSITDTGLVAVSEGTDLLERPTTNEELHCTLKRFFKLNGQKGKIFDCLAQAGRGNAVPLGDIVKYCNYEGKNMNSFKVMLAALTGYAGLAVKEGKSSYLLTDVCFLDSKTNE